MATALAACAAQVVMAILTHATQMASATAVAARQMRLNDDVNGAEDADAQEPWGVGEPVDVDADGEAVEAKRDRHRDEGDRDVNLPFVGDVIHAAEPVDLFLLENLRKGQIE